MDELRERVGQVVELDAVERRIGFRAPWLAPLEVFDDPGIGADASQPDADQAPDAGTPSEGLSDQLPGGLGSADQADGMSLEQADALGLRR